MIIDTNALSDFLADNEAVGQVIETAQFIGLPAIVLGEYFFGLNTSSHRRILLPRLERFIHDARVLDVTVATARHYAAIRSELSARGQPIPENDVWIAALARQHNLPIVSRDTHFDRIEGLVRLNW
jgi:tRNA(fMet)-specific endonuclease VapC